MKRFLFLLVVISIAYSLSFAQYGRSGDLADPTFLNTGDSAIGISVNVSSTTPTQVYLTTTTIVVDRELLLQNPNNTYNLYCGTHSALSATAGNRFFIPPRGSYTSNGMVDLWCIAQSGVSAIEVLGSLEFDSRD